MDKDTIIGVVGQPASGKDTVADYLLSRGFEKFSGGDYLRAEAEKLGIPLDRESIHTYVTEMREKFGNSYPYNKVTDTLHGKVVSLGMRNTEEVKTLKNKFGNDFILVAVLASPETRYERMKLRNRVGDNITFEEFNKQEEQEKNASSGAHQVDKLIEMSDIKIDNNGTEEEFHKQIEEKLKEYIS